MDLKPLPFRSPRRAYEQQAEDLQAAHHAADPVAIDLFHRKHPRFLDEKIKWLPKSIPDSDFRDADLSLDDALLAVARFYDFLDWPSLSAHVDAISHDGPVFEFECAVEAVVNGDLAALEAALHRDPMLVHARSTRVCCFDPPGHRATLLHYVAANGVEAYRQKTPANAVAIARALLQAGSAPDALADMYGAECTTMAMLVSSDHPAKAGLQVPLLELLLDFGADIEGRGTRKWGTPLVTALTFGMSDAAHALARRGALIDLLGAAGLGRADEALRLLPTASATARHRALALAAQHGHADVVGILLDDEVNPDRFNPEGHDPHSTPLHQAAVGGHLAVVQLLIARGARLDIEDKIWRAKPLGWALHASGRRETEMTECLRGAGAVE